MPKESFLASLEEFRGQYATLVESLRAQADCARWALPEEAFSASLWRSAEKRFRGARPAALELEDYLKSLHLEDLALACACGEGIETAWEFFMAHFRQDLRHAASAMLRASGCADESRAQELADSLHAELYGVRSGADGRRKSLFEYFHGRSKLSTWLRAVLAQRQIDAIRMSGRTVSLEDEMDRDSPRELGGSGKSVPVDPARERYIARFAAALSVALASLSGRERMILACYYVDGMTLAEIGKMLHEHESTVSRQLERLRRALRETVTQALRREIPANNGRPAEAALDAAQVELAFEYALGDWSFDLSQALLPSEAKGETSNE